MKKILVLMIAIITAFCLFSGCYSEDKDGDGISDMTEAQAGDIDDVEYENGSEEDETVSENGSQQSTPIDFMTVTGRVLRTEEKDGKKRVIVKDSGRQPLYAEVSAEITDKTIIVSTLLEEMKASDIKEGDEVRVILDTSEGVMTPDMAYCEVLIVKKEDNTSFPHYICAADTEFEEGVLSVLNSNGDVIIDIAKSLEIGTTDAEITASYDDIKEGCGLLCWYDSLTLSDPAKAVPTRVAIISYPPEKEEDAANDKKAGY